jgi:beta-barrel assembly-enhancing protease
MPAAYRAIAYAPELPNGAATGEICFADGQLRFSSAHAQRAVSLDALKIRLGGSGGKEAFFNHPDLPQWEILLVEGAGLLDPALQAAPHLAGVAASAAKLQRKMTAGLKFLLWLPLIILALLIALFLALEPLVNAALKRIPVSSEVQLGNQFWKLSNLQKAKSVPPELQAKLDKALARLLPSVADAGYPFEFTIIENPTPNAFAFPGGKIGVHTGLLELAETPEHVAGVLAHEIAHVTQRHSLEQMLKKAGVMAALTVVLGDTSLSGLATAVGDLQGLAYSRDAEREADAVGWNYLIKAEINPKPMIEFFEALQRHTSKEAGVPSPLSTHPATQERIDTLTGWLRELPPEFKPRAL